MKINESEVSSGNASGKAGVSSLPFGRGYYSSGGNDGSPGIKFTPDGEPSFKTYKSMKHSKKNLKKKMKHLKTFEMWTTDATGDFDITYGDKKPEISEIVKYTKKYIEDNFDKIHHIEQKEKITFKTIVNGHPNGTLYSEITLQVNSGPFYEIKFTKPITRNDNSYSTVDITKDEYNYLNDFFYEINKKLRKIRNEKGVDELEKDIIPYKKDAKKYNL